MSTRSSITKGRWPGWLLLLPLLGIGLALSPIVAPSFPKCLFFEKTGQLCPGCGATRSALALHEGRIADAMQNNVIFAGGAIFGGLWILLAALGQRFPGVGLLQIFRFRLWFLWVALAGVLAFWVTRNLLWFDFLRPV